MLLYTKNNQRYLCSKAKALTRHQPCFALLFCSLKGFLWRGWAEEDTHRSPFQVQRHRMELRTEHRREMKSWRARPEEKALLSFSSPSVMQYGSGRAQQFLQLAKLSFIKENLHPASCRTPAYHVPHSCIVKGKLNPRQATKPFPDVTARSSNHLLKAESPTQPLLHKDALGISLNPRDRW